MMVHCLLCVIKIILCMLWNMPSHLACVVCVYMQNQGIWEHADVVIMIKFVSWHNTGFCLCILFAYSACSKVFRAFELYNIDKCDMYLCPIRIWGFFWGDFQQWKQVYLVEVSLGTSYGSLAVLLHTRAFSCALQMELCGSSTLRSDQHEQRVTATKWAGG
jgi:hypothetical protein